jgi:hypothetical protein
VLTDSTPTILRRTLLPVLYICLLHPLAINFMNGKQGRIKKYAARAWQHMPRNGAGRMKYFVKDILIVVLGVTITILGNNWTNGRQDQATVKAFLTGIRENLMRDTAFIYKFINEYEVKMRKNYVDSVLWQINSGQIDTAYIDGNSYRLVDVNYLFMDNGLYQSFSASGNLKLLKNQKLLSRIVRMYDYLTLFQHTYNEDKNSIEADFRKYIGYKTDVDSSMNSRLTAVIHQPEVRFFLQFYSYKIEDLNRQLLHVVNAEVASTSTRAKFGLVPLILEIDKELKANFD